MKSKEFKMECMHGTMKVKCEYFATSFDLVSCCQSREPAPSLWWEEDYFGADGGRPSQTFNGFSSATELIKRLHVGCKNENLVKEVKKFKESPRTCNVEDRCERRRSVSGGQVSVARFLRGKPDCFTKLKYADSKSDVLKVAIDTEVTCNISSSAYEKAGLEVCKAILALESAGYQVDLHAIGSFATNEGYGSKTGVMCLKIKSAGEAVNAKRILYPLTDISFFRGIAFGWVVRSNSIYHQSGLGSRLEYQFHSSTRTDDMADFYEQVFDEDTVVFNMSQLVDMIRDGNDVEQYITSSLLSVDEE